MARSKPLTKEQMLAAMGKTKSNRAAARYLNVSYIHYKGWAKLYKDEATGITLFDKHKNPSGKGIPKFLNNGKKEPALIDVIEGRIDSSHFNPQKIKYRLIEEGLIKEECHQCKFQERRVLDYKMPLILHFKDNNKKNYRVENLEMLCYNCYFLTIGDIFTRKQLEGLEDHKPMNLGQSDWEVDDYTNKRLAELGLGDGLDDNEYDIISKL